MTFQPVVPISGYAGWRFLQRTMDNQVAAFEKSQPVVRATDYFRENIGKVRTAEDLVSDRRLLEVALGAYGLDDDIDNKFFIRKILEDGTTADDALANRLSDKRYFAFSLAFGLSPDGVPRTNVSAFVERVIDRFETKQFARAVGQTDPDMRLALNVSEGVADILKNNQSDTARWFSVMGNAPLRRVFEAALGLPSSIGRIDLDQQLDAFRDRARSVFGTDKVEDFTDPERQEDLIRLFLVRAQVAQFAAASGGSTALTLLQNTPSVVPDLLPR